MIGGVAFCPQTPALVPEVGRGLDAELAEVRAACRAAIRRVTEGADHIVVIGSADATRFHRPSARGSFAGFGVPLEVALGSDEPGPLELPASVTVGAWLLRDALGPDTGATGWSIGPDAWVELDAGGRTALVVAGDGTACRDVKAPGYLDPRAAVRDEDLAIGLRQGRGDVLNLLPEDHELLVGGANAWDAVAAPTEPVEWNAELLYEGAPFGVGYFVAAWTR